MTDFDEIWRLLQIAVMSDDEHTAYYEDKYKKKSEIDRKNVIDHPSSETPDEELTFSRLIDKIKAFLINSEDAYIIRDNQGVSIFHFCCGHIELHSLALTITQITGPDGISPQTFYTGETLARQAYDRSTLLCADNDTGELIENLRRLSTIAARNERLTP